MASLGYILIPSLVVCTYVLLTLTYIMAIFLHRRPATFHTAERISILVAARDEEANIEACLDALAKLDYPAHLMEVWVGDDDSSDGTAAVVQAFCAKDPRFHYVRITERHPNIHGKQNVLAQLARKATGDYLLITDADIQVHPRWAGTLMAHFTQKTGMVSGPTFVEGKGIFAMMQSLDWLMGCTAARAHSLLGIPITGVGNNMALRRTAYESVGGYENVPFSVTEDYKLFQVMCEKGEWEFVQLFEPAAVNVSEPMTTLQQWFRQRRRWFRGGLELAWYNLAALFINALSIPAVILIWILAGWKVGIVAYGAKLLADFLLLATGAALSGRLAWLAWFPFYEIYYHIIAIVTPLQQLIPGKVRWKGREY